MKALTFHAGPLAMAQIAEHGLRAQDVAIVPAAAGGPKGLIFQALDQWMFGEWFPAAPRQRTLIGASIGAWRMAAACQKDPVKAFALLGELYAGQRYTSLRPSQQQIDEVVQALLQELVSGHEDDIVNHAHHRLHLLTVRGLRSLAAPAHRYAEMRGFASAALHNAASRVWLARLMERVVIGSPGPGEAHGQAFWLRERFDGFTTHFSALTRDNLAPGLLASGTLPLIMKAVTGIADVPPGSYWDGGIIDYHLALPYARAAREGAGKGRGELVLYPHFTEHIVPGWLDKSFPWRRAARGANRGWLDNVLLVAPSEDFLGTLPRGKLPDRADFRFFGLNHDERIRAWKRAIGEGERLRDELAEFALRPDLGRIRPI
jgi:hypothetical protein